MSRRNAMLPFVLFFALFGPGSIYAQSDATAHGNTIWEADAPMAAAATTCFPSSPPELQKQFNPDGSGWDGPPEPKNRYLAVTAGDPGRQQTIRVLWDAMPNWSDGYVALEGQQKWLLEPFQVCENANQGVTVSPPDCGPSPGQPQKWFWAARLACDESRAWYGDLSDLSNYCTGSGEPCTTNADCSAGTCGVDGVIHIVDRDIVPSKRTPPQPAVYAVQVLDDTCSSAVPDNFSDPLLIENPIYGDIVITVGTCPNGPPNGDKVDIVGDVIGGIIKFSNLPCAPKKTRCDMEPAEQDFRVNITDVLQILGGFRGFAYPYEAGDRCPASREP